MTITAPPLHSTASRHRSPAAPEIRTGVASVAPALRHVLQFFGRHHAARREAVILPVNHIVRPRLTEIRDAQVREFGFHQRIC